MMRDRPNLMLVMADQMAAPFLPVYGHRVVKAPTMARLAENGVVFDNAYCNFPLCAPSRFSMLTGRLASRIGAFDNAAELPAAVPTVAHHLRLSGYRTCLAGKMHFIGPDQLHGFEERVTTDIYPADFGWTPDWDNPGDRLEWFHSLVNVAAAGPSERTLQIDFDDEVAFAAVRWLYDHARDSDDRPFFLITSFSHPHDPYNIPRKYWDRYDHDEIDLPAVPPIAPDERDPHSRRLWENYDRGEYRITERHVRNARHAYYGAISYVDDRLSELLDALDATGRSDDTIVVVASDHGDMLGERGLWFKMCFFEAASRVPLIVHAPHRFRPGRVGCNVSLVDMLPTLLDLAGVDRAMLPVPLDGESLQPLLTDSAGSGRDTVLCEYLAEGTDRPLFMVRKGRYKYTTGPGDPPQLFDVAADPGEVDNLADDARHAAAQAELADIARRTWDADAVWQRVIASQRARRAVFGALATGRRQLWDYAPPRDAARDYIRNLAGLYEREARAFLPRRSEPTDDDC